MNLDEMKLAWSAMEARLDQHSLDLTRDRKLAGARAELQPLVHGQRLQVVAGVALTLFGGAFWQSHAATTHLLIAGLAVHLYGVALIALAVRTLILIRAIDLSAPVVDIQRQLLELRTFYVRHALAVGLPWWILWMVAPLIIFGLAGIDLWAARPLYFYVNVVVGLAGIAATIAFVKWSRGRATSGRTVDDALAGSGLRNALRHLESLKQFEEERA